MSEMGHSSTITEDDLLQEAMRRLDAKFAARQQPTGEAEADSQPQPRTLLQAGREVWDNRIIVETDRGIGKPDPNFEGVDLRDVTLESGQNAYDRYQELSGHIPGQKPLKEHLARLIRSQAYQSMPDGESGVLGTRLNALASLVTEYRQTAKRYLIRENVELRPLVQARQREARAAAAGNPSQRTGSQPGARELLEALSPTGTRGHTSERPAQSFLDGLRQRDTETQRNLEAIGAEREERLGKKREDDIRRADGPMKLIQQRKAQGKR